MFLVDFRHHDGLALHVLLAFRAADGLIECTIYESEFVLGEVDLRHVVIPFHEV